VELIMKLHVHLEKHIKQDCFHVLIFSTSYFATLFKNGGSELIPF
jgi:hypothetical protein